VKILFAVRDIKKGEEICISYVLFDDIFMNFGEYANLEVIRLGLSQYGIVCDANCLCFDKTYSQKLYDGKRLDDWITAARPEVNPSIALTRVKKLLELEKELNLVEVRMKRTLFEGFRIAIMRKKTRELGLDYIREAYELAKRIVHPEQNELVKKYKKYMDDPSALKADLWNERRCNNN